MAPRWAHSTDKHGIPRDDQVYALINATYKAKVEAETPDDGQVWLYIGPPHAQTEREIEILVATYPHGRESLVFHAMELGPKYRRRREEHPHGD